MRADKRLNKRLDADWLKAALVEALHI